MTGKRGEGDAGLAEDLLPLVERQREPEVDFLRLADLFIALTKATAREDRDRIALEAKRVAGKNAVAQRMVERKLAEVALGGAA